MAERDLFGGAIKARLPVDLKDASEHRQVPDNQEVFLYPDSNASIIIEVLERVSLSDDKEAVKFHFEALAHDNDASSSIVQAVSTVQRNKLPAIVLRGTQSICKFNAIVPDEVEILVALFRVPSKEIDLVASVNIPRAAIGEGAASAIRKDFESLVQSLHIFDYGLFG